MVCTKSYQDLISTNKPGIEAHAYNTTYMGDIGGSWSQAGPRQNPRPNLKTWLKQKKAGNVTQVVE
jgi:hypothetical protein